METRICSVCGKEKSLEDFYRNKTKPLGRDYWCKECQLDYNRQHSFRKERHERWAHSPEGKEQIQHYNREHYLKNKEKHKAKDMINKLIQRGEIKRMPCQECGDVNTHGHHPNYTEPLQVVWLCQKHHWQEHNT